MDSNHITPKLSVSIISDLFGVTTQAVHKQIRGQGISLPTLGNKGYIDHLSAREFLNLDFKRKVVVGQIVKGGVGKTTIIDNIACCANAYGARVLKIDLDPQGNLTDLNGINPEQAQGLPILFDVVSVKTAINDTIVQTCPGMDIIPSRLENAMLDKYLAINRVNLARFFHDLLEPIEQNYDFIFIDCPPTMGLSISAASLYSDLILAPINPEKFSSIGLDILMGELETLTKTFKKKMDFRIILNKFSTTTVLSSKALADIQGHKEKSKKLLSTAIPLSQEIPNSTSNQEAPFSHLKRSDVRDDLNAITMEALGLENMLIEKRGRQPRGAVTNAGIEDITKKNKFVKDPVRAWNYPYPIVDSDSKNNMPTEAGGYTDTRIDPEKEAFSKKGRATHEKNSGNPVGQDKTNSTPESNDIDVSITLAKNIAPLPLEGSLLSGEGPSSKLMFLIIDSCILNGSRQSFPMTTQELMGALSIKSSHLRTIIARLRERNFLEVVSFNQCRYSATRVFEIPKSVYDRIVSKVLKEPSSPRNSLA